MLSLLNPCGTTIPTNCVALLPTAMWCTSHLTRSDNVPTESVWAGEKRAIFALTPTDRPVVTPGRQGLSHSLASDALWSLQYVAVVAGKLDTGSNPAEVEMTVSDRPATWVTPSAPDPLCLWRILLLLDESSFCQMSINRLSLLFSESPTSYYIKCRTCNGPWFFL